MTSTSNSNNNNKPFHTYENAAYAELNHNHYAQQQQPASLSASAANPAITTAIATNNGAAIAINKNAIESPFTDPLHDPTTTSSTGGTRILSATDSTGTTRTLTSRALAGQNLVTKLISFPSQSPMDSFKEWSVSTFKCTKQLINEKRGICSITNDAQLQADIEQLRENRNKLVQMLLVAQQMNSHYTQLVKTQRQLHGLMNEMSIKCFTNSATGLSANDSNTKPGKQVIANFSNLSNNLSATTTTAPTTTTTSSTTSGARNRPGSGDSQLCEFLPILDHIKSSNVNLTEDFKKNGMALNATIKNGEKLVTALNFFCSNIKTLLDKTIQDTLATIKQFELARLEYDAERNSLNFTSQSAQTSINYSSDRLELSRARYEQLKEDVQIKMKFLEENTIKVLKKQLVLFNSVFAAYSNGNTAALESALRQFSIR